MDYVHKGIKGCYDFVKSSMRKIDHVVNEYYIDPESDKHVYPLSYVYSLFTHLKHCKVKALDFL